jgi:uncharacterized protein (TIGR00725 family)
MGPPYVAVIGAGIATPDVYALAEEVGRLLAERGAIVVSGGMTGVMEAASKGARSAGGTTVGILPGRHRSDANEWIDIAITTGLGEVRNALVVRAVDVAIAVAGEFGTLSEMALALKIGTPVVGLGTWTLVKDGTESDAIRRAETPAEAVAMAERLWSA